MEPESCSLHPFVARCGEIFADLAVPTAHFRQQALKTSLPLEDLFSSDRDTLAKWVEGQCHLLWREVFEHYVGQKDYGHLTEIAAFKCGSLYTQLLDLEDALLAYQIQAACFRKDNPNAPSNTKSLFVEGYRDLHFLEGKVLAENGWKREWLVEGVDMKEIVAASPALAEKLYKARRSAAQHITRNAHFQGTSLILHAE